MNAELQTANNVVFFDFYNGTNHPAHTIKIPLNKGVLTRMRGLYGALAYARMTGVTIASFGSSFDTPEDYATDAHFIKRFVDLVNKTTSPVAFVA